MNTSFQKILIIQTAFIGDVILATSMVESLVREFPKAKMDMLVRKGNDHLIQNNPHINEVLIWNKQDKKYRSLFQLVKEIKKSKYDLVINTQRFGATGLLTVLSGAKVTSGFKKNPFSLFFTHRAEHHIGDGTHEIERNFALISSFVEVDVQKPRLYPTDKDEAKIKGYTQKPLITISPQSVWFTKMYPSHKWVELVDSLPEQLEVFVMGGPGDTDKNEHLITQMKTAHRVTNLAGKLSLLQSAALMKYAQMNYVNDSGPLHLCSAMNAPVTAFFCSTIPEFGFTPLSDNSQVIQSNLTLNCRPCGLHGYKECPKKHFECGNSISPPPLIVN